LSFSLKKLKKYLEKNIHRLENVSVNTINHTCVISWSDPVPSSSLNIMLGFSFLTRSLNLASFRVIFPSGSPLAPIVFSETFGTCCLYTRTVRLPGRRLLPGPRRPHCNDKPVSNNNSKNPVKKLLIILVESIPCKYEIGVCGRGQCLFVTPEYI